MITRAEAQARIDRIRLFGEELAQLQREQVLQLSAEQAQAVAAHHDGLQRQLRQSFDVDTDAQARQLSLGMRIASFLGALSLAASVFFFFYRFWGDLGVAAQVLILAGAPLVSYVFTLWLHGRDSSGYFTKLAAMVCFACFVLDISMLGQIFDITPSDRALLAWGAFGLLLAYGCDSRLLLVAAIGCLASFIAARAGTWGGAYWIDFGERPENFFPAAILLLLVPRLIDQRRHDGFALTYRVSGLLCLYGPILVLANWSGGSYLPLDPDLVEGAYQVLGFAGSAFVIWLGVRHGLPHVVNTSVSFFVVLLYTKFYDWWWEIMPKYLFFLVLGLTAVLLLLVFRRLRGTTAEVAR
jgi:uncharacterized membrane protein